MTLLTGGTRIANIGAGAAGLASARALLPQGFACTLFERANRLGGGADDKACDFAVVSAGL